MKYIDPRTRPIRERESKSPVPEVSTPQDRKGKLIAVLIIITLILIILFCRFSHLILTM